MADAELLAARIEQLRPHLRSVAYRLLGTSVDAEDAVQEAWLRASRVDSSNVENLSGWLTTVVARVSLDMLRRRKSRRETSFEEAPPEVMDSSSLGVDPEDEVIVADSVGEAILVVLETLTPAERVAFVLHDMFGVSFEEIGRIIDRSPAAARQVASRSRRRVRAAHSPSSDRSRHSLVVAAFFAASREGNLQALIALLHPGAILQADAAAAALGAEKLIQGQEAVAANFSGRARAAILATVDGEPGGVWQAGGKPRVVFGFTVEGDTITRIDLIADPVRLSEMEIIPLVARR